MNMYDEIDDEKPYGKQRIILFIGSPVKAKKEELTLIGKKLKKYNISVDIISFGHVDENKFVVILFNFLIFTDPPI